MQLECKADGRIPGRWRCTEIAEEDVDQRLPSVIARAMPDEHHLSGERGANMSWNVGVARMCPLKRIVLRSSIHQYISGSKSFVSGNEGF